MNHRSIVVVLVLAGCYVAPREGDSIAQMDDDPPSTACAGSGSGTDTDGCEPSSTSDPSSTSGPDLPVPAEDRCRSAADCSGLPCVATFIEGLRGPFVCATTCVPELDEASWCADDASCCDAQATCNARGYCR